MRKVVGISQKIKRAWLDAVLDQLAQTTEEIEMRCFLNQHLREELPSKQSRDKALGIILRIWNNVPPERVAFRDRAVALLSRISGQERIWLHWGMTGLAYPFFRDVTEIIGRLVTLQSEFTTVQVQDRMLIAWGDRTTTREATQKLITSLVDWGVVGPAKAQGQFLLFKKMDTSCLDLQLWLLEALLRASAAGEMELQHLLHLPESFPFAVSVSTADLRRSESFNINRQGLDTGLVSLNNVAMKQILSPATPLSRAKAVGVSQLDFFSAGAK